MEISDSQIAHLVLGYLKSEKCKHAYREFQRTSKHLKEDARSPKGKVFVTRVFGLSLTDLLSEYAAIYNIVQAHLEASHYFNEHRVLMTLPEQLTYLLNKIDHSTASTPCPMSPADHHGRESSRNIDVSSDVETTPVDSLPGNARCGSDESYFQRTPKRKTKSRFNRSDPVETTEEPEGDVSMVLAQTLLENKELHEKLAETINRVRNTPENITRKVLDEHVSAGASAELDSTIKTVVRRTEEDPIFDKILDEIIGSTIPTSTSDKVDSSEINTSKNLHQSVEEQNNEAIQSIITASNTHQSQYSSASMSDTKSNTSEVIVFDGSLDNYIKSSTPCHAVPKQNLYVNTGGLLMVPSSTTVPGNMQYDAAKQIYLMNGPPVVNMNVKPSTSILSEQEIMAMPTVIVNDQCASQVSAPMILHSNVLISKPATKPKKTKILAPKPHTDVEESLGPYLNLHPNKKKTGIKTLLPKLPQGIPPHAISRVAINIDEGVLMEEDTTPQEQKLESQQQEKPVTSCLEDILPTQMSEDAAKEKISEENVKEKVPEENVKEKTLEENLKEKTLEENLNEKVPEKNVKEKTLEENLNEKGPEENIKEKSLEENVKEKEPEENVKEKEPEEIVKENILEENVKEIVSEENVKEKVSEESAKKKVSEESDKEKTPPKAVTPPKLQVIAKSTPKSGSHVRNLDFSTPPKLSTNSKKKIMKESSPAVSSKKQAAKTLFPSKKSEENSFGNEKNDSIIMKKSNNPFASSWDADLRALAGAAEQSKCATPKRKPIKSKKKKPANSKSTIDLEAMLLEKALETPVKKETVDGEEKDKSEVKEIENKRESGESKKGKSKPKQTKNKKQNKRQNAEKEPETEGKNSKTTESAKQVVDVKAPNLEENFSRMILSPSKFNANKRKLVKDKEQDDEETVTKFKTPDNYKENSALPITAKRNISALLETPVKDDVPVTPCTKTPFGSQLTPFTKVLEAHLEGVDINSLPTPSLPITPSFPPLTPTVDLFSPYANRPTDYSTSSSYYQPSDNEQNKSLEKLINECNRLENLAESPKTKEPAKSIITDEVVVTIEKISFKPKENERNDCISAQFEEHVKIFNKNVIGKKNLSLVNRRIVSSSSSSRDSSSSESSSDSEVSQKNCSDEEMLSDDTVICKKKPKQIQSPPRQYLLRTRAAAKKQKMDDEQKTEINSILDSVDVINTLEDKEIARNRLLQEMEEKRKRTISKFKEISSSASKISNSASKPKPARRPRKDSGAKAPIRSTNGKKTVTSKETPKTPAVPRKNRRKSDTPKKKVVAKMIAIDKNEVQTDEDFRLHLSEDDEPTKKIQEETAANQNKAVRGTGSDQEAEKLVKGLKQWGIHLMHNKSPKKSQENSEDICNISGENVQDVDMSKDTVDSVPRENSHNGTTKEETDEELDTRVYESEDLCVVFDENSVALKKFEDYDLKLLEKKIETNVYVVDREVEVVLQCTSFQSLFDWPSCTNKRPKKDINKSKSTENASSSSKNAKEAPKSDKTEITAAVADLIKVLDDSARDSGDKIADDELMNYAIVGSTREENSSDTNLSPKCIKKRKNRSDELGADLQVDKKCKLECPETDILKKVDVDAFLNTVHGKS